MSNAYDSRLGNPPPRSGIGGAADAVGTVWSSLKETWKRIASRISFWTVVGGVALFSTIYYFAFAESLYDSETVISIQNKSNQSAGVSSILGSALGGTGSASQTEQVQEYIQSMEMLNILDKKFHLRDTYSSSARNPFWRLYWPQTDEDFLWFYQHMVAVEAQTDVGLMTIDVYDYDRKRSKDIADTVVSQTEKFMNQINQTMQGQTMKFARSELEAAVKAVQGAKDPQEQAVAEMRLTAAQQALAAAEGAANAQQVFIVPISAPLLPTETTEPQRLFDILSITFVTALIYAVGFLMWANVRDHRKA